MTTSEQNDVCAISPGDMIWETWETEHGDDRADMGIIISYVPNVQFTVMWVYDDIITYALDVYHLNQYRWLMRMKRQPCMHEHT